MPSIIKLNSGSNGNYNVSLNGNTYFLRTYWNQFANRWFLDFMDINKNPIMMGCAIVNRKNLFNNRPQISVEIGEIWSFDLTGGDCEKRDALGTTTVLVYFTPNEFNTFFSSVSSLLEQQYRDFNYRFSDFFTVVS